MEQTGLSHKFLKPSEFYYWQAVNLQPNHDESSYLHTNIDINHQPQDAFSLVYDNGELEYVKSMVLDDLEISTLTAPQDDRIMDAIHEAKNLKESSFQPGLYYVVLIDLVGSTKASYQLSPEENISRIKRFIGYIKDALEISNPKNHAVFIKDIGDAALFLFADFQDILNWANTVDESLKKYNDRCINEGKKEIYQMFSKKCVHLGEVHFEESNPIALAINQIFKIEKEFKGGQLGVTDAVRHVILPRINSGQVIIEKITEATFPGENVPTPLWSISMCGKYNA